MQFLLTAINAKYIHSNPAVYSLKACVCRELQDCVTLAEYTINHRTEEILADLYQRKPDVIGFSCYIWNITMIRELISELPKILPETDIWLGGPEVSFEAEAFLENYPESGCPTLKGIMVGEGEQTFRELLSYYAACKEKAHKEGEASLKRIRGLVLRDGYTGHRVPADINKLSFPYGDLQHFKDRIIYYETSRGCPFRCSYCLSSVDKSLRMRDLSLVKRELQFFLDKRVPQVKLIDRTFNADHHHAMEIWQYIKEHDNGVTNFHFEVAADIMNEAQLALLSRMRPGLIQLEIGVQTTNKEALKEIRRHTDAAHMAQTVARIRRNRNIHIHLDLIAGLPLEDYDSFKRSFNDVYAMRPEQLQLGFLKVLKGTRIRDRAGEYGIVYQERPPYEVLYTRWISYGEICRLKRVEEMVELYYNSGQFAHTLSVLEREFADPFAMFEELAGFYEKEGYFIRTPARGYRYQALLKFALKAAPEREGLYRELLTYDYYLRENAKSRPDFCRDLTPYREEIWHFYQREEENPVLLADYKGYHARQIMKMTHMEAFFYPVWEAEEAEILKKREAPALVVFDYRSRDVLTGEAGTKRI